MKNGTPGSRAIDDLGRPRSPLRPLDGGEARPASTPVSRSRPRGACDQEEAGFVHGQQVDVAFDLALALTERIRQLPSAPSRRPSPASGLREDPGASSSPGCAGVRRGARSASGGRRSSAGAPRSTSQVARMGWRRRLVRRESLADPSERPADGREEPDRKHRPISVPSLIARSRRDSSPGSYVRRLLIERVLDSSAWWAGGQDERSRTTRRRLRENPPLPGPFHACTYESTQRAGESAGSGARGSPLRSRSRPRAVLPYPWQPLSITWRKRHRSPVTTSRSRSAARLRDAVLVSTSCCPDLNQLGPGLPRKPMSSPLIATVCDNGTPFAIDRDER